MREQIYVLLKLQEIDSEIEDEERKQKRLPDRIREIGDIIENIEKKYQQKKENLKEQLVRMKRKEIDAKTINAKIDKHQDELYGGKINEIKELKQLQRVIETLKDERDRVEEDLLIFMEEEDNLKADLHEIEKELSQAKDRLENTKKEVDQQKKTINENIEQEKKKRAEIISKITNPGLLERYKLLWTEKEGKVVVEIEESTCSGCNLSLPSDIIYHLQRDDRLITCPNCNRILVWNKKS